MAFKALPRECWEIAFEALRRECWGVAFVELPRKCLGVACKALPREFRGIAFKALHGDFWAIAFTEGCQLCFAAHLMSAWLAHPGTCKKANAHVALEEDVGGGRGPAAEEPLLDFFDIGEVFSCLEI